MSQQTDKHIAATVVHHVQAEAPPGLDLDQAFCHNCSDSLRSPVPVTAWGSSHQPWWLWPFTNSPFCFKGPGQGPLNESNVRLLMQPTEITLEGSAWGRRREEGTIFKLCTHSPNKQWNTMHHPYPSPSKPWGMRGPLPDALHWLKSKMTTGQLQKEKHNCLDFCLKIFYWAFILFESSDVQ